MPSTLILSYLFKRALRRVYFVEFLDLSLCLNEATLTIATTKCFRRTSIALDNNNDLR